MTAPEDDRAQAGKSTLALDALEPLGDPPAVTFSAPVLQFLAGVLGQLQLSAGAPDFEQQAALIARARRELGAALASIAPVDKRSAPV